MRDTPSLSFWNNFIIQSIPSIFPDIQETCIIYRRDSSSIENENSAYPSRSSKSFISILKCVYPNTLVSSCKLSLPKIYKNKKTGTYLKSKKKCKIYHSEIYKCKNYNKHMYMYNVSWVLSIRVFKKKRLRMISLNVYKINEKKKLENINIRS